MQQLYPYLRMETTFLKKKKQPNPLLDKTAINKTNVAFGTIILAHHSKNVMTTINENKIVI